MPKKRRARRPNIPLQTGPVPREAPANAAERSEKSAAGVYPAPAASRAASTQLKTDYTYVMNDLKRIAIVGGGLIAVLVALSFIIK